MKSPTSGNLALYIVHCKTTAIARQLCKGGNVTRVDMSEPMPTDGLFRFRCLPRYRSPDALVLRQQVADLMKAR